MDAEEVLELFDSYWFDQQIFTNQPIKPKTSRKGSISDAKELQNEPEKPEIDSRVPSHHHVRSLSDQLSFQTFQSDSYQSPKSVLQSHKLQPILSGKEATPEDNHQSPMKMEQNERPSSAHQKRRKKVKSLSDLEFEELKGFIDLGFVFSEEDKNSSLVSIIPGLQRLGKKDKQEDGEEDRQNRRSDDNDDDDAEEILVSRPYLSEAWGVLDRRKEAMNPLMNWRVPANLGSEIAMKDHLKHWAHTVASTVM